MRVPVVLIFVPPTESDAPLTAPVTERSAVVPVSVIVKRVLASPSLRVNVPSTPAVAKVRTGEAFVSFNGVAPDKVTIPLAVILVAPAIAPVFVIPPLLLFIPPVIDAPPELTVRRPLIL